jgi:diguanylate cyclase (GGDEF)-like protein
MVDIDLFKRINDTYGHLTGDAVLRDVAHAASKALRQLDFFGRYGGEEFVMVLTDTPLEGAMVTAERVRSRIEQLEFPGIAPGLRVTVSIGVAEHVRRADSAVTLRRADEALYRAKEGGRNRSESAPLAPSLQETQ